MDASLKLLADASLEVTAAEDALDEGAFHAARDRLDAAGAVLADLRAAWPSMGGAERGVVGPAARSVRDRLDAAGRRVPRLSALSEGAPEMDPEQNEAPDAAA
jgi:hypothetical protein